MKLLQLQSPFIVHFQRRIGTYFNTRALPKLISNVILRDIINKRDMCVVELILSCIGAFIRNLEHLSNFDHFIVLCLLYYI